MSNKYHNPSGFPENLPPEQIFEEEMKNSMRKTCSLFGYIPLETSAVEYLDTLASNGEINKEIYAITRALGEGSDAEPDRALRFDLTIPFARYVAQHYGDIVLPFKRFQIQRVWRGERSQKGRFREFYQADIDVIANEQLPLHLDAEVVTIIYQILQSFGIGSFTIHINNRKFLQGVLQEYGITDIASALRIIDKFDKIGRSAVKDLLIQELQLSSEVSDTLLDLVERSIPIHEVNTFFQSITGENALISEGKEELLEVFSYLETFPDGEGKFMFNPRIARGLDYYTGSVFETTIDGLERYGSICSGGRYANLAERFINKSLPGVGISIGLTRLLDIIRNEKPELLSKHTYTSVLIGLRNEENRLHSNEIAQALRENGIATEVFYKGSISYKKQFEYKTKKQIPFFLIVNQDTHVAISTSENDEKEFNTANEAIEYIISTVKTNSDICER